MFKNYRLERIPAEDWRDLKAFAALQEKTVRDLLLGYIHEQVLVFRAERGKQGNISELIEKAGKRI